MYIKDLPIYTLRSLIITIIIEVVVALIIGIKNKKYIINIILVNILTNPMVNSISVYFNFYYSIMAGDVSILILEILAFMIEAYIYKLTKVSKYPIKLSLILNISSYLIGLLINYLF